LISKNRPDRFKMDWKTIVDFENYEVNELGEVRRNGKMRKACINNGYYVFTLCKDNKRTHFTVHRLIALYFIPNPDNLPCVDHINGIRTDNRIENLRWCTKQQNEWNNKGKGYRITKYGKYVAQIRQDGKFIYLGTFDTPEEARQAYETKFIELRGIQYLR